ncbi:MAG: DUF4160 domain-containing protein [Treponema sp.]|nr:DUF4160 domain-containing protein [Treponema sp.]
MHLILTKGVYRFYLFSREESRKHVHVSAPGGEVKIWLEPFLAVAKTVNLSNEEVYRILQITEKHREEILEYWTHHFSGQN